LRLPTAIAGIIDAFNQSVAVVNHYGATSQHRGPTEDRCLASVAVRELPAGIKNQQLSIESGHVVTVC
jgi:hypothetical protein